MLKKVDLLRHELKALRFMLDRLDEGGLKKSESPAREDFQSEQCRDLYDAIAGSPTRAAAEQKIGLMELEGVDLDSFLRLSGDHYYSYPRLVKQRAQAIRSGRLVVENA